MLHGQWNALLLEKDLKSFCLQKSKIQSTNKVIDISPTMFFFSFEIRKLNLEEYKFEILTFFIFTFFIKVFFLLAMSVQNLKYLITEQIIFLFNY